MTGRLYHQKLAKASTELGLLVPMSGWMMMMLMIRPCFVIVVAVMIINIVVITMTTRANLGETEGWRRVERRGTCRKRSIGGLFFLVLTSGKVPLEKTL